MFSRKGHAYRSLLRTGIKFALKSLHYHVFGIEPGYIVGKRCKIFKDISSEKMSFYAKRVGPKLKAVLEEASKNKMELLDITEEITLSRLATLKYMEVLEQIEELKIGVNNVTVESKQTLINNILPIVKRAWAEDSVLVERGTRIFTMLNNENKLSPNAIDEVVKQISKFHHACFHDHPDALAKFDNFLNNVLELPTLKGRGTSITPDMQVMAMDATIPTGPDVEEVQ